MIKESEKIAFAMKRLSEIFQAFHAKKILLMTLTILLMTF